MKQCLSLEEHSEQRLTKDGVRLGRSRGGSSWQTRTASECGPMCPVGCGMNQGPRMSALSDMGAWNQVSRELETQPSRNLCVLVHCRAGSCSQQQKSSYPHKCVKAIVLSDFFGCNGKTSEICHKRTIRWSSPSKQGSYSATISTSWDEQACTHDTLWRQYYVKTSKEYLINSHILLKYF